MAIRTTSAELIHAGAGTTLVASYFALIPGVLPTVVIGGLITAVLLVPVVVLGLAAAVVIAPPYGLWRLVTRSRRRNRS